MKTIKIVQFIIHFLFYISVLMSGVFAMSYPVWFLLGDKLPYKFEEIQFIYNSNWSISFLFLVVLIIQILFTVGFYHLKNVTQLFIHQKSFSKITIKQLKKAGVIFTFIGILTLILRTLNWIFDSSVVSIWNGIDIIYLFILFNGLFFILISTVLTEAKELKQENDLTI